MSYEGTTEAYSDLETTPTFSSVEDIERHAQTQEEIMSARETELLSSFDDIQPETPEQERVLDALKQRALELSGPRLDLKVAAQTAALSVALEGLMSGTEGRSLEREAQAAHLIASNPELAEMLMQKILTVSEHLGHEGPHTTGNRGTLVAEAKGALSEMPDSDSKLYKGIALRTAERITRALISASTLGIGVIVYDTAKDLYVNLRARSEARTRQRLMTSAAIPAV